eukprot:TRINITY_DN14674_c0_g1_i2.p1 TRINITY_DN14674_c0_g1~~TRINITY_DN14674_c0_g1_i2.p1  ORF type:complete len:182 (+),score=41.82 TRINITY_DN14674_c0_g1_i2:726-1271(+)
MSSYIEKQYNDSFMEGRGKTQLKAFTRLGPMKVPENLANPLILIATGVGIVRFEGLLEEVAELKSEHCIYVYYGCKDKDSIFASKLSDLAKKKVIDTLELAISQNAETKKHVQDIIMEHKEELYYLIKRKSAVVMVCASLAIETSIKEAFLYIFKDKESDADKFFDEMKTKKQYVRELWSI